MKKKDIWPETVTNTEAIDPPAEVLLVLVVLLDLDQEEIDLIPEADQALDQVHPHQDPDQEVLDPDQDQNLDPTTLPNLNLDNDFKTKITKINKINLLIHFFIYFYP